MSAKTKAKVSAAAAAKTTYVKKAPSTYTIDTASTKPGIQPIIRRELMNVVAPTVFFTPQAYEQMSHIVKICPKEVGWFFLVEELEGGDFLLDSIYIPKQEVTSVETDIDADAMTELALKILDEGKDPSKLFAWFHSHVNMGVSPSGQDESQVEDYLDICPLFIRGIVNKKGEMKVDVYYPEHGVAFTCVETRINYEGIDDAKKDELSAIVKKNVVDAYIPQQNWGQRAFNTTNPGTGYDHTRTYQGRQARQQLQPQQQVAVVTPLNSDDPTGDLLDDEIYDPMDFGITMEEINAMTEYEFQYEFGQSKSDYMDLLDKKGARN